MTGGFYEIKEPPPGSKEPHLIICLNTDVSVHAPPVKRGGRIPVLLTKEDPLYQNWLLKLGNRLANLLGLRAG